MRLEFDGKQQVYGHHLTVPISPLIPDYDESVPYANGEYDDENLIIHGDNLRALKALMPRYAGKVKCVFIDPPYNTGNEGWVYNDNVNSPLLQKWLDDNKPVDGEDMDRHDKWACMMWPRLHLLRELLSEDGVIFITIDDNEQASLKLLLDEIFGADNFVSTFIWRKKAGGGQDSGYIAVEHDYILVYKKSQSFKIIHRTSSIDSSEYKHDIDGRKCKLVPIEKWGSNQYKEDRPKSYYSIKDPDGNDFYPIATDGQPGCWRTKPENLDSSHIYWRKIAARSNIHASRIGRWQPCEVQYFDEQIKDKTIKERSILYDIATTTHSAKELLDIFGKKRVFETAKPVSLLKRIIKIATSGDSIVLDSFAGSGTTAHAVLALNAAGNRGEGGSRKFILVECEEYADTITAERVRRVISGVPTARDEQLREGLGGSFTFCTLGEPVSVSAILSGELLPSFHDMAVWAYHTATGKAINPADITESTSSPFYQYEDKDFWLLYEPDIEWLRSPSSALSVTVAEHIADVSAHSVVFASHKHMSQRHLSDMRIVFCQLPYGDVL